MANTAELSQFISANPVSISVGGGALNDSAFTAWLGPTTNVAPLQPWENRRTSMWTMPAQYIMSPSQNIENTFTLTMLTLNNFLINFILPMKVTDQITFTKQAMIFGPHLPNRVPHLGPVRFVNSYMQRSSQTLIRYGLGFQMEHEQMKTQLGAQILIHQYKQIAQAFIEHMQLDAINALLNADDWERSRFVQLRGLQDVSYTRQTELIMEREKDFWAYVQQEPTNAWAHLDAFVEEKHGYISPKPLTTWIVDHRVTAYCRHVPTDQTKYSEFGPGNQQNVRSGIEYFRVDERGNAVYATRAFYADEVLLNSLEHIRQTGGYWIAADPPGTDYKSKYTSHDRTIEVYDEEGNCLSPITLDKMIANCNRFTSSGTLKTTYDLPTSDKNTRLEDDPLYHLIDGKVVPLAFFGQLKPEHFTTTDQQHLAESVCAQLVLSTGRQGLNTALRDLDECMRVVHTTPRQRTELADILNAFNENTPTFRERITGSLAYRGNQFGSLDIDKDTKGIPLTHGNYAGFKSIENYYRTTESAVAKDHYHIKIITALPIFEAFVDNLKTMFPNSAVFKVDWAAPQLAVPTIYDVFFDNLIGRQYPSFPIYKKRKSGRNAVSPSLITDKNALRDIIGEARNRLDGVAAARTAVLAFDAALTNLAQNAITNWEQGTSILKAIWYVVDWENFNRVDTLFKEIDSRIQARLSKITVDNPAQTKFLEIVGKFRSAFREFNQFSEYAEFVTKITEEVANNSTVNILLPFSIPANLYADLLENVQDDYPISRWDTYAPYAKKGDRDNIAAATAFAAELRKYRGTPSDDPSNQVENLPLVKNAAITQTSGVLLDHSEAKAQQEFHERLAQRAANQRAQNDVVADIVGRERGRNRRTFESGSGSSTPSTTTLPRDAFFDPNASVASFLNNTTVEKQLTNNLKFNFASACSRFSSQPEFLCIVIAFLWTPITEQALLASFDHDIMHVFEYIVVQAHRTHVTVDGIKTIPGSETGNTLIAHVNVEIGNDPTTQTYNAALRMYHGAVINDAKNIFVVPNMMVTDYMFGGGMEFCQPERYDPVRAIYGRSKAASLMVFLHPRNTPLPLYFSLTGAVSWRDPMGMSITPQNGGKYSFPTASFEEHIWGFKRFRANNPDAVGHVAGNRSKSFTPNMLVCRDAARYHNQTDNSWTRVTSTSGHFRIHLIGANKKRQRLGKDPVTPDNIQTGCTTFSFPIA